MKSMVIPAGPLKVHRQSMKLIPFSDEGAVALNTISQLVKVQLQYSLPSSTTVSLLNDAPSCRAIALPLDRHVRRTSYGTPGDGRHNGRRVTAGGLMTTRLDGRG